LGPLQFRSARRNSPARPGRPPQRVKPGGWRGAVARRRPRRLFPSPRGGISPPSPRGGASALAFPLAARGRVCPRRAGALAFPRLKPSPPRAKATHTCWYVYSQHPVWVRSTAPAERQPRRPPARLSASDPAQVGPAGAVARRRPRKLFPLAARGHFPPLPARARRGGTFPPSPPGAGPGACTSPSLREGDAHVVVCVFATAGLGVVHADSTAPAAQQPRPAIPGPALRVRPGPGGPGRPRNCRPAAVLAQPGRASGQGLERG
jgi:hypothetical protein